MQPTLKKWLWANPRSEEDKITDIEHSLKILGITLEKDLSYKPHVDILLKNAYAKIAA